MSMTHRAYAFAHSAFTTELAPFVVRALSSDSGEELSAFIDANLSSLTDPYEGEPLDASWRDLLEEGDVQELADFALTKFYDGDLDMGLDQDFQGIFDELEQAGLSHQLALGTPLGEEPHVFDPGRQGSYFQSEAQVASSLLTLHELCARSPELEGALAPLLGIFQQATRSGRGLYVTF
jgi:hypothetical protein